MEPKKGNICKCNNLLFFFDFDIIYIDNIDGILEGGYDEENKSFINEYENLNGKISEKVRNIQNVYIVEVLYRYYLILLRKVI